MDYQELYLTLFRATEKVLRGIENDWSMMKVYQTLMQAQQHCEDLYIEQDEKAPPS